MNRRSILLISFISGIAAMAILSSPVFGSSEHDEKHHRSEGHEHDMQQHHAANPLIEEMVKLDAVFRDVVSGVAMDDGRRVHEALEKMHGTMERTHEGVHHGTVTLKKNAGRLKDFIEQDKRFHAKLDELAQAAHRNDGAAMLSLTKDLLDRCVKCHRDYR